MRANFMLFLLPAAIIGCGDKDSADDTGGQDTAPSVTAAGEIHVSTKSIDFGQAEDVGIQVPVQILIENRGVGELTISDYTITAPFSMGAFATPLIIQPNSSTTQTVYYIPDAYIQSSGALVLISDDPDDPEVSVALYGGITVDEDGDGHWKESAGGDDCDDDDPNIYLGAEEIWYDGTDQNCDGADDYDQDGDGYQSSVYNEYVSTGGGDCNDAWADIHPGAVEEWYDGVDADCDGSDDWDQDGDGYGAAKYDKGSDCDDEDAEIYPNAIERLNNKLDDCNADAADVDMTGLSPEIRRRGIETSDQVGAGIALGDVDDDGIADLLIGAPGADEGRGALTIYLSSDTAPTGTGSAFGSSDYFYGDSDDAESLGQAVVYVDDFTSDAEGDVFIGAPNHNGDRGRIYLIEGSTIAAGADIEDATLTVTGTSAHYYLGAWLGGEMDLNGDGLSDLVFEYKTTTDDTNASNIGLLYGGAIGDLTLTEVDAWWAAAGAPGSTVGYDTNGFPNAQNMSNGGDVDGDGYDDWVYCDPLADTSGNTNNGAVYMLRGGERYSGDSQGTFSDDATRVAEGYLGNAFAGYGCGILPDLDHDGNDELWFFMRDDSGIHINMGSADLLDAPVTDHDSDITIELYSDWQVSQVRSIGDWDGDYVPEIGVGINGESMTDEGALFLYNGASLSGDVHYKDDAFGYFIADEDDGNELFGWALPHRPGDIDGDGTPDLLVSDPGWSEDYDDDTIVTQDIGAFFIVYNNGAWE